MAGNGDIVVYTWDICLQFSNVRGALREIVQLGNP